MLVELQMKISVKDLQQQTQLKKSYIVAYATEEEFFSNCHDTKNEL